VRSHILLAREKKLLLGERTAIMGVVNVTADSFYEGSRYPAVSDAVDAALALIEAGADIIDIGGESTRPGSEHVPASMELGRVQPVLEILRGQTEVMISVDTRKSWVAERVLALGADVINDISALDDEGMVDVVARASAGIVLMHMQGSPETMQQAPAYRDVVGDVSSYLRSAVDLAEAGGVARESILVDPGIGFGKTLEHNLQLLANLERLAELGKPILVGTSRKSFIGSLLEDPSRDRVFGTAGSVAAAILNGASVVRVHDVREMADVACVTDAIRAASRAREEVSP
jgi:dihydropteroate synthase